MKNERGERGGQSDETPGSRRLTTPITVISDEEEESQGDGNWSALKGGTHEGEEAGNGDKEEDEESSNSFFLVLRIQRAYLIILLEKGGIIHKIWFSNVDSESG